MNFDRPEGGNSLSLEKKRQLLEFGTTHPREHAANAIKRYESITGESLDIPDGADVFQKANIIRERLDAAENRVSDGAISESWEEKEQALSYILNLALSEIDKLAPDSVENGE